jgi:glycosyltransferase involved in cell wall biosynthesis
MYIVHAFYPESYTGTEKFVLNMAKSMQKKGHSVKVVTYSKGSPETFAHRVGTDLYREYDYEGVPVLAYRQEQLEPAGTFEADRPDLTLFAQETLLRTKPDLVHIGHPMRAMEFMQSCVHQGIRYVVTLTDFWFICPRSTLLQVNNALCQGPQLGENCRIHCHIPDAGQRLGALIPLLKSAVRILSPSASLANLFRMSIPDLNVDVLHHGMNYEAIRTNERVYGPGDRLTLFYGGSLNMHKGVHLIIQAFSMIPSERLQLRIYGSGDAEAAIHSFTTSLRYQLSAAGIEVNA